jgi:DNA-binding transcriptional ArsR family regulator
VPENNPRHFVRSVASEDGVAMRLLGIHPLRTEIYRLLADHRDGATAAQLSAELDVHHRTVRAYLHKMECEGALTSDDAPEPFPPHWRGYQLNHSVRDAALARYVGYIGGSASMGSL